jgi:F-type H+-transporting ATPase subunit b
VNLLASIVAPHLAPVVRTLAEEPSAGFQINLFWVIVNAGTFILFLVLANGLFGSTLSRMLRERRERIAQGLEDAEQARIDRANAEKERAETLAEARRESREILERAQKVAQESRDADIAATKAELERLRERATSEIEAEKVRAIAALRAEVADLALAAAAKVVGASMTGATQRRLVEDFLSESAGASGTGTSDTGKPN